jgi:anaerobic selenocysteine-containing dehydrogenase
MSTIGDDLLRDRRARFGPKIEALVVYNSNPVAVAPESGKVVQGFAREDLFTVVLEHFQTDTADYADYILPATTQLEHWDMHLSYGHTDVLLNRPAIAPLGEARQHADLPRPGGAHGLHRPLLCRRRRDAVPQAFGDRVDFDAAAGPRLCHAGAARGAVCPRRLSHAVRQCEFFSERLAAQGLDGLPDHLPNHELAGSSARYPLAMISPPARNFLNSSFRQRQKPARHRRRAAAGDPPHDASARGIASGAVVRVFNDRGSYRCKAEVSSNAPAPAWSTAWASGGASWGWTAPT